MTWKKLPNLPCNVVNVWPVPHYIDTLIQIITSKMPYCAVWQTFFCVLNFNHSSEAIPLFYGASRTMLATLHLMLPLFNCCIHNSQSNDSLYCKCIQTSLVRSKMLLESWNMKAKHRWNSWNCRIIPTTIFFGHRHDWWLKMKKFIPFFHSTYGLHPHENCIIITSMCIAVPQRSHIGEVTYVNMAQKSDSETRLNQAPCGHQTWFRLS